LARCGSRRRLLSSFRFFGTSSSVPRDIDNSD
jgi:hypothetical protein